MPRKIMEALAHELSSEMNRRGIRPCRASVTITDGGWRWRIEGRPDAPEDTPCGRDIVSLLRGQRRRLSAMEILHGLDQREQAGLAGEHSDSSVRHTLVRLVKADVLTSSRRSPQGYALSEAYQAAHALTS